MAKRPHGTGHVYVKWGSFYGRWRSPDGRLLNRRIGKVRERGTSDGLTRRQAERALRELMARETTRPRPPTREPDKTVDDALDALRARLALEGARPSYRQNCESMQRVHLSPRLGSRRLETVDREAVEQLALAMLRKGLARKTVLNVLKFLHQAFALAVERGWTTENPVTRAARPKRRRHGVAAPDLQFLTLAELEAVLDAIPDHPVYPAPSRYRSGREGPAPPPPADVLGPVLRVLILAAATTGLRQSELLGLRWRDVDWRARRLRVRNAYVRGEHSGEGKSDLSTRRSVPLHDRLNDALATWRTRSVFADQDDLVFAHPELGSPLDRTKVTRRFKKACRDAGVPEIRFHDLRHTFATQLAASGTPMRTLQEFLGHADLKTTQIYAHYAPSAWELDLVNRAFTSREEASADE